jgi:hypothetical protein
MARRRVDDDDDDDDDDDYEEPPRRAKKKATPLPPGTPITYVHEKCDGETEMPEEEIRKYLKNPIELGEEPTTYCSECDKNVPWKRCFWKETEQNLYEYIDDLRGELVVNGRDPRDGGVSYNWLYPIAGAVVLGLLVGAGSKRMPGVGVLGGLVAAVVGFIGGAIYMWYEQQQTQKVFDEWNDKLVKRYYKRHPEAKKSKKRRRDDD